MGEGDEAVCGVGGLPHDADRPVPAAVAINLSAGVSRILRSSVPGMLIPSPPQELHITYVSHTERCSLLKTVPIRSLHLKIMWHLIHEY